MFILSSNYLFPLDRCILPMTSKLPTAASIDVGGVKSTDCRHLNSISRTVLETTLSNTLPPTTSIDWSTKEKFYFLHNSNRQGSKID